jgi:hypothetical protein
MGEAFLGALLCSFLGGSEVEARVDFQNQASKTFIRVDCLTQEFAFEFGLDKVSSRDSVHQAVMASELTNTEPFVVIIDTDGVEGKLEQEMRRVTGVLGIRYARCGEDFIQRWAATSSFRSAGLDKSVDDLPRRSTYDVNCPLAQQLKRE